MAQLSWKFLKVLLNFAQSLLVVIMAAADMNLEDLKQATLSKVKLCP